LAPTDLSIYLDYLEVKADAGKAAGDPNTFLTHFRHFASLSRWLPVFASDFGNIGVADARVPQDLREELSHLFLQLAAGMPPTLPDVDKGFEFLSGSALAVVGKADASAAIYRGLFESEGWSDR